VRIFALRSLAVLSLVGCSEGASPEPPMDVYPLDSTLRVNHIQMKGTHNSYHVQTEGSTIPEHQYTHAPLDVQISQQGVRAFELDTRYDKDTDQFRVFHLGFVDEETTCATLVDCLGVLAAWSASNPLHQPIFVQIEPKDALPKESEAYFQKMEAEILSRWPREKIMTPDDVQGSAATLREAVTTKGWPTLGFARGKIVFYIDNSTEFREQYTRARTSLAGRLMFADGDMADPYAAVMILNDSKGRAAIDGAVQAGFLVRTRADGDVSDARDNDTTARDAALVSGAQIISTDFPAKVAPYEYFVELPGGKPSRCNPLIAPPSCTAEAIEDPARLR
jgi:hypothetical protein